MGIWTITITAVSALFALTGCVTTPTVTEEQMSTLYQRQEACKGSTALDDTRCRIKVRKTFEAEVGVAPNPHASLLDAKVLELAERIDAGELTQPQAQLEYQEYLTQVSVMQQQQQAAAAAQRSAASAAMMQTGLQMMQPRRPLVTCNRLGSTVTCY